MTNRIYVVIEGAGTDDERDIAEFPTLIKADAFIKRTYDEDEIESLQVQIIADDDGERTTEF